MALCGTLCFCTDCGDLLPRARPSQRTINCDVCGTSNENKWPHKTTSVSKPSAFPSQLRQRLQAGLQEVSSTDKQQGKVIQQACEKCSALELRYFELQLRSADEGTTLLYHCLQCGHRFKEDN
ncbi:hypothetical protein DOTSEDRAFT_139985 [Dothistroma septosporum NZE10]|uniref:DNA-directed RNA polymerase subunit n=1 Tax=Dothistroma septosporum (strain NZE10 / CBS 128990) TaxID=675120 RepID=M2YJC0_DOTSN|nr:hypothetical protein DOTSEDRAFT_139985 [Dothistroma septosporum NZE10]